MALLSCLFHKFENPEIIPVKHLSTWLRVDAHEMVGIAVLVSL